MVKITAMEAENVKRIKAVKMVPTPEGLTIVGGDNGQGKTSVLDAIMWTLGGNRYKPSKPHREGSVTDPYIKINLSNGLTVERKGKSSALKVVDQNGNKGGQALLDAFISELALDLGKFIQANGKEKAETLLKIIGVGDQLHEFDRQIQEAYNQRLYAGQIADQKAKHAKELPVYPDAPLEPVSVSELIMQQQEILARNGRNQALREEHRDLVRKAGEIMSEIVREESEIKRLKNAVREHELVRDDLKRLHEKTEEDVRTAEKTVEQLQDESTAEIEANIRNIETINEKVRANIEKAAAETEAASYREKWEAIDADLKELRAKRIKLLEGADLPLEGLSIEGGELVYKGQKWDGMSGSDQLKVAVAIVRRLNPECGFVLVDKLEQMDMTTLTEFGAWAEKEGLQLIGTRVSKGDECEIIIEDGYSQTTAPKYKEGVF